MPGGSFLSHHRATKPLAFPDMQKVSRKYLRFLPSFRRAKELAPFLYVNVTSFCPPSCLSKVCCRSQGWDTENTIPVMPCPLPPGWLTNDMVSVPHGQKLLL